MREALSKVSSVCETIDLWTNRQMRSYLGITGQYVQEYKLVSAMFACKRFKGRHTAESIYSNYVDVLKTFNITNKVSYIISDNASNMTKAFTLPGFQEPTVADTDTDYDSDSDITSDDAALEPSEDMFDFLPEHQPCFAHTLQLCVKDGMNDAGTLRKVIARASSIVTHVRKSTHATDLLENDKRLQAANKTRWNSEVKMLKSVLNIPKEKLDQLDTQKLSHHERTLLSDLVDILSPFQEATDYAQTQNAASAGYIIPCILGLKA